MTEASPTTFELIVQGIDAFGEKVRAVPADAWTAPTPCADWSVRDLVNHVTGEHLWAPHLLEGETIAQVGDRYDGDVLGDSPVAAWEGAAQASRAAWLSASPDDVVHLSFGDNPALAYGEQMLSDLLIHGWDLARGAGLDETMEPAAVARVLGYLEPNAKSWEAAGIFAAPVQIDSAEPASRLLALSGRRP
jgi:uncharacterized protein (TIGR03086 family)